jgi:hypothetical protein
MSGRQSAAVDRALARVRQGSTATAAAAAEGCAVSSVSRAMQRAGMPSLPPGPPPGTRQKRKPTVPA